MDLVVDTKPKSEIEKILFQPKPINCDGRILKIYHQKHDSCNEKYKSTKLRFTDSCFNKDGNILACINIKGQIIIIDLLKNKYWLLQNFQERAYIKFSLFDDDLLVCLQTGEIYLIKTDSGCVEHKLIGHKNQVNYISFLQNKLCLTSSILQAIIWNLEHKTKLQVLKLDPGIHLKFATFVPVSGNILACFEDQSIHIWKHDTFESLDQINSSQLVKNYLIRNVTFSENGTTLIIAGNTPKLIIYSLNPIKLCKILMLPGYISTVRYVELLTLQFDWKCSSKILAILAGQGVIYFYNLETENVIDKLLVKTEIIKFVYSQSNQLVSIILCTGEIYVYNITKYINNKTCVCIQKNDDLSKPKMKPCMRKNNDDKNEIQNILCDVKLKSILMEYGQYPENYRTLIWEILLQLPNNVKQYDSIINHFTIESFPDIFQKYPLESKHSLRNLIKLLNNIVTWCPFFANVDYLPVFVFPFVKQFHNKPIACFEAICTIIFNWCQFWFEYFPLPPVNILAIIENIILELDPELLNHLTVNNITSSIYIWPLLETAFSEVLLDKEWCIFWDHVLTNEISFFLCATVSYNIIQRTTILNFKNESEFKFFYHNQNPIDVKRLISKTYHLLNTLKPCLHPRQYLNQFKKIDFGRYPIFLEYPKTIVNFQNKYLTVLEEEMHNIQENEDKIRKRKDKQLEKLFEIEKMNEEHSRVEEMQKACMDKIFRNQEKVKAKYAELEANRSNLIKEEKEILEIYLKKLNYLNNKQKKNVICSLLENLKLGTIFQEQSLNKAEDALFDRYLNFLKQKCTNEEMLIDVQTSTVDTSKINFDNQKIDKDIKLLQENITIESNSLNIVTELVTLDQLINDIEQKIIEVSQNSSDIEANRRLRKLEDESNNLQIQVNKTIQLLQAYKNPETLNATKSSGSRKHGITCLCKV